MASTAFSTSDKDAIERTINVDIGETTSHLSSNEFEEFYEIELTAREIIQGNFNRVGVRFGTRLNVNSEHAGDRLDSPSISR
jgi:diphthamide biosynthesis protein 2